MALGGLPIVDLTGGYGDPTREGLPAPTREVEPGLFMDTDGSKQTYSVDWSRFDRGPAPAVQQQPNSPLDALVFNNKAALDSALAQSAAKRAELDKQDEPALRTLHELAQVDIQAIQDDPELTNEEKQAKLKDAEIRAKKQEIQIRAKTREDRLALDAFDQEAKRKALADLTQRQHDIALYDGLAKQGLMAPHIAQALQMRAAGQDVPLDAYKPKDSPQEIARTQYMHTKQILDDTVGELLNYRRNPKTGEWQQLDDKGEVVGVLPAEQQAYVDDLEARRQVLVPQAEALFWKWHGSSRPPSMSVVAAKTMSPIGKSVQINMPAVHASAPKGAFAIGSKWMTAPAPSTRKPLTEAQALAFLQQTSGNKDQARELARKQGYEIR